MNCECIGWAFQSTGQWALWFEKNLSTLSFQVRKRLGRLVEAKRKRKESHSRRSCTFFFIDSKSNNFLFYVWDAVRNFFFGSMASRAAEAFTFYPIKAARENEKAATLRKSSYNESFDSSTQSMWREYFKGRANKFSRSDEWKRRLPAFP